MLLGHQLPGASVIEEALNLLKSVRSGTEEQAILAFNSGHKQLKEARKRSSDLADALTEPALLALSNARETLRSEWTVLAVEDDLDPALHEPSADLADLLAKETFYKELAAISQHAATLSKEYGKRHEKASQARLAAYQAALTKLASIPGWDELNEDQQTRLASPLKACAVPSTPSTGIALLRADTDACPGRTQKAIQELLSLLDGTRLVRLDVNAYFAGGIETTEQLDTALTALRDECEKQLAEGKRILIQ